MNVPFQSNLVHCVIPIRVGSAMIPANGARCLYSLFSEIARSAGVTQVVAGGMEDHVHILLSIPPTVAISTVVDRIKSVSQRWMQNAFPECKHFRWDEGCTAFSVGISQLREAVGYIERQLECHRKIDFSREMALFEEAHEIGILRPQLPSE